MLPASTWCSRIVSQPPTRTFVMTEIEVLREFLLFGKEPGPNIVTDFAFDVPEELTLRATDVVPCSRTVVTPSKRMRQETVPQPER